MNRYQERVARFKGCAMGEDGLYYNEKKLVTVHSLETWDEETFGKFIAEHLDRYNLDMEAKILREESDRKAAEERAAAAARIEEQNRLLRESEERARKEAAEKESNIFKRKLEEQAAAEAARTAADYTKLRTLAEAFSQVQIPQMSTEKGIATAQKFEEVQEKWVAGMLRLADELEGINEEVF